MTKTKVFLPTTQIRNGRAIITGDDVHHLRLVLRKQVNDQLLVAVDGQTYCGIIRQLDSNQIVVELGAKLSECAESPVFVRLYQGMPKGDKLDLIIQKTVELGVNEIVPFFSKHTVVKLTEQKQNRKLIRWQRIALEAAKQCKRDEIPQVKMPLNFSEVVKKLEKCSDEHLVIMPYENALEFGLKQLESIKPKQISIIVGPEGGFSADEVEAISALGGKIIHLGKRILRTETAAIAVITLVQFLWGDLG
ncbi:MAG: 16S rRNA (uracil(1498)-N(3))-methyltransferase [Firmicutes bacterium]|nr:16S rRNA (uracil(1498)-N(3))-methyltransferase [Bacillota bacterium]